VGKNGKETQLGMKCMISCYRVPIGDFQGNDETTQPIDQSILYATLTDWGLSLIYVGMKDLLI